MNHTHRHNWKKRRWMFIPFAIIALFGISLVVMFLWNMIIPDIFHLDNISYLQAMGLLIFCRILFGGFLSKRSCRHRHQDFREKFMNMTDDERSQFMEQWKVRQSE